MRRRRRGEGEGEPRAPPGKAQPRPRGGGPGRDRPTEEPPPPLTEAAVKPSTDSNVIAPMDGTDDVIGFHLWGKVGSASLLPVKSLWNSLPLDIGCNLAWRPQKGVFWRGAGPASCHEPVELLATVLGAPGRRSPVGPSDTGSWTWWVPFGLILQGSSFVLMSFSQES